jgi:UDP-N-acetylmuramoyl-tripeptide--D-alanyl-D-alanine ligase
MKTSLWSYADVVTALQAELVGSPVRAIQGVSIDSRTVAPGDVFFAIKGDRFDGHAYVADALAAGAAVAVVAREKRPSLPSHGPFLVVEDVLAALVALGVAARERSGARIAAVTGSVGKTGTKEALRLALARSGETHASVASFNNHWGVPLTLARTPLSAEYGVFEIGMNHAGEITPLTGYVRPHVAIVTTVEPVHLEFFANVEGIAEAKAEIFLGLEPGGAAVLNMDNPHYPLLARRARERGARIVGFGANAAAEARLLDVSLAPEWSTVAASILGERVAYKIGAPGRHLVQNSLAVLAAVKLLGADLALGALALAEVAPPKGRGARLELAFPEGGTVTLVDESYNANPASMRVAIELLGAAEPAGRGRRIAVLGDMRELGEAAPELHAELAEPLERARVDLVFCCGPHMKRLWEVLPAGRRGAYASDAAELEGLVLGAIGRGDVVMVKGSLGTRMGPIVEAFKARLRPAVEAAELREGV